MAKKKEKLMLGHMISEDEKYNKLKTVNLPNGLYTEVYVHFRPSKIDKMLNEFVVFKDRYDQIQGEMSEADVTTYLSLFTVLHFSTIVGELPETFEGKLDVFQKILDSEYGEKIAEAMDQNEVMKISDIIFKKLLSYEKLKENEITMKKKFKDEFENMKFENKDLLRSAFFEDETVEIVDVIEESINEEVEDQSVEDEQELDSGESDGK